MNQLNNPPQHCPGPNTEQAGKESACQGCPNQIICSTSKPKEEDPDIQNISHRLKHVHRKLCIMSGKGGVGKSTVTCTLGWALSGSTDLESDVGILDIDITGPSIPKMLGVDKDEIHQTSSGWTPIVVDDHLCCMSIGFMLPSEGDAVIWKGPKKNGLIKQFLRDVDWGTLDYLLIDTPPGTSDEHLSVSTYLQKAHIDGVILVTTPQQVSLQDVRKQVQFCFKLKLKVIGVIENMSAFVCPSCHKTSTIFKPTTSGAEHMCKAMNIPFLGSIPLDPRIGISCDQGRSFMDEFPDSPATLAYTQIVQRIIKSL